MLDVADFFRQEEKYSEPTTHSYINSTKLMDWVF